MFAASTSRVSRVSRVSLFTDQFRTDTGCAKIAFSFSRNISLQTCVLTFNFWNASSRALRDSHYVQLSSRFIYCAISKKKYLFNYFYNSDSIFSQIPFFTKTTINVFSIDSVKKSNHYKMSINLRKSLRWCGINVRYDIFNVNTRNCFLLSFNILIFDIISALNCSDELLLFNPWPKHRPCWPNQAWK